MAGALTPGGWLFLGASEVISKAPTGCAIGSVGSRLAIQRLSAPRPADARGRQRAPLSSRRPAAGPRDEDAIERALARLEAGRNDEAIMLCTKVLEDDPLRVEAFLHLVSGMAFHLGKDPESAVRALSSAVLLDPQLWPRAFFYLGQALEKLGSGRRGLRSLPRGGRPGAGRSSRRLGVLDAFKGEIATPARGARAAPRGSDRYFCLSHSVSRECLLRPTALRFMPGMPPGA